MSGVICLLLVVTMPVSWLGCEPLQTTQSTTMPTRTIGSALAIEDAASQADYIFVATLSKTGEPDAGAAGQHYFSRIEVTPSQIIRGGLPPTSLTATLQVMPEPSREIMPLPDRSYIWFVKHDNRRVVKVIIDTEENRVQFKR